jgi:hypothetical protein
MFRLANANEATGNPASRMTALFSEMVFTLAMTSYLEADNASNLVTKVLTSSRAIIMLKTIQNLKSFLQSNFSIDKKIILLKQIEYIHKEFC